MNPKMRARRQEYLYRKNTFIFRLIIWISVIVMLVQAIEMMHGYVTRRGIYNICFGSYEQELTKSVIDELTKLEGFTGFYPIYTMEAEVAVQSYLGTVLLKGIDFTHFPVKLAEVNQDVLNDNLFIIGTEAFNGLVDINGLSITGVQKEKLLNDWKELSIVVKYGGEDDINARKKNGRIAGILNEDFQDIFISEDMLCSMIEESGGQTVVNEGLLQIKGQKYAAKAEQILQDAGFMVEGELEGEFNEYQGDMQQNGAVLMIAGLFFVLAMTALKRLSR